jgi:hypothetical protein
MESKKRERSLRVPLKDESGPRVGYKLLENGNYDIAVIRGDQLLLFELPPKAWKAIKKQGYIDLKQYRQ